MEYTFPEDEEDAEVANNYWTHLTLSSSFLIPESNLLNPSLALELKLPGGNTLRCPQPQPSLAEEIPDGRKREAELQLINQRTFELVQLIQKGSTSKKDKLEAYSQIQEINRNLDAKMEEFMKVKDRQLRKVLLQGIQESKQRTSGVISILRECHSLENLQNATIAQLNDLAYKGVQRGGLQKLIDKRAIGNDELYQKLEQELKRAVKKIDFKKIESEQQQVIADLGDCIMSCMNTVETMQSHDCMAIGLSITRPEAAIADPSRVVVNDIFPTYVNTESFLESARYKLVDNQYQKAQAANVHGGFSNDPKGKDAQVVMGAGRENITGVLPLALFDEHWAIARRKMQPILGFMCTLDVLGYSSEQYFTIPFTVLATALHKVAQDPSEINKRMLHQIQDTCIRIVTHSKTFRQELITNLINFQTLSAETSFRTTDKIKGINCFLAQFYTLLSINNFESMIEDADQKAFFSDQAKLLELKRTVVRFAVEEQLRRVQQKPEKVCDNILQILFPSNKTAFVDPVWDRRKKEVAQLFKQDKADGADAFEKHKAYANVLREQYGYGKEAVPKDDGQIDSKAQNGDQNKDAVDFA